MGIINKREYKIPDKPTIREKFWRLFYYLKAKIKGLINQWMLK